MMRNILLLFLAALSSSGLSAQQRLEFDLVARYDKHADYTTRFGDRSYTDDISLWGFGKGLQLKYFHPVTKISH